MNESAATKSLVIYGAAHAVCLRLVGQINRVTPTWKIAGFLDDTPELHGTMYWGFPILGGRSMLPELASDPDVHFFNNVRGHWSGTKQVAELLDDHGGRTASLIHPAVDLSYVEMGRGAFVASGCVISAGSSTGEFVSIMSNSVIGHDVTLEDFTSVSQLCSIGSNCVLKARCFMGPSAVIIPGRTIGYGATVGAGAVVTKDVPDEVTVFGVPARPVERKSD